MTARCLAALFLTLLVASGFSQEPDAAEASGEVVRLWPIERIGGEANRLKEEYRQRGRRKQLRVVKDPNLTIYRAKSDKPTPAVTYAKDDKHYPGGVKYVEAVKEAGYPIHFKVYETGGHGMKGCDWFEQAARWLKDQRLINKERSR